MPIYFKVISRGEPGVPGGGVKKFYASPELNGELTLNDLTKLIEDISSAKGADIRAVLYALVTVAVNGLENGKIVRLGDLGSLRPSFNSDGKKTKEEVKASAIKRSSVVFTPGSRIKDMLRTVKYKKA